MNIYYLYNTDTRDSSCSAGLDYTPSYIEAIIAYMGITADKISREDLHLIEANDILIVGAERIDTLPCCNIILLGSYIGSDAEPSYREEKIFAEYIKDGITPLPLFVPIKKPFFEGEILSYAKTNDELFPALIKCGKIYEFTFDLAASVWFSEDGFVSDEGSDYFFIGRTPDTRPIKSGDYSLPYNDILIGELEGILYGIGASAIYRLPPDENRKSPDLLISFSGDDDCTSKEYNLEAALTMEGFGFPYHINAMPERGERFVMTRDELINIASHNCEIALHTNFTDGVCYSKDSVMAQVELFKECFGYHPYTNTNHCFIQGGSTAERMRWFYSCGILADNGKLGEFDPSDINAFDLCGFGFGTSFPRMTCDDSQHLNVLIKSLEIPINYYEPRLYTDHSDTSKIVSYIDSAAENARIAQFFIHPHYLEYSSRDREAVLRVLSLIQKTLTEKDYSALFTSVNRITDFWLSRMASSVKDLGDRIEIAARCELFVVINRDTTGLVLLDSQPCDVIEKNVSGKRLSLVFVPSGEHTVTFG